MNFRCIINFRFLALLAAFAFGNAQAQPLTTAQAQSKAAADKLASQRFHYQKAKDALAKNDTQAFKEHYSTLGDYPLMPYLEFAQIRGRFSDLPFAEIDAFLARYPDTFLESRMRETLLSGLASRQKWPEYLHYYRSEIPSMALRCRALEARAKTGDNSAYFEITELWNVGKSQPEECNGAFDAWKKAGKQTEELTWSRFHKAMQLGDISFASGVAQQLKGRQALAKLYLKVNQKPALVKQQNLFTAKGIEMQQIISLGVQQLAQKNAMEALRVWESYESQRLFADDVIVQTKLELIKRLIRSGNSNEAQQMLSASRALRKQQLIEELARDALASLDWRRVGSIIALLDDESRAMERWQYWGARTQDVLNTRLEHFEDSRAIYQKLAKNRSFYGFLSADIMQQSYSLADLSKPINPIQLEMVASSPDIRRARELWATGNLIEAKAEWMYLSKKLPAEQLAVAGQLARDWGWYSTGIQTMANGNLWDQLAVRFPLAYREQIFKVANDIRVEPTLIFAIARQESAFNDQAKSPVGAMGLMQIMPQTAVAIGKKTGIKHTNKDQLLDANYNMLLGTHYLNDLLTQFDGNRALAAAAYNAGPSRVNRWLSDQGKERPIDVWIETIPFQETRNYVQNVLCFSVIYAYRLGKPTTFLSSAEAKRYL